MDYYKSKNKVVELSELGFGCCPMGLHGWGDTSESELIRAVHIALERGVTLFDTADIYGLGTSERILGKALGDKRSQAKIASKFGVRRDSKGKTFYDNSSQWIDKALEASLKRLNTEYLDLYQVHYHDKKIPLEELFEILENKCNEGKIVSYGVSNIHEFTEPLPPNLVSFSMEYSLSNRENESVVRSLVDKHGLSFLSWGSLGQGILSGAYDQNTVFSDADRRSRPVYRNFHGNKFLHNLEIIKIMKNISEENGRPLPQIAIRWILDNLKSKTSVLLGIKCPADIESALGAFEWQLTEQQLQRLNSVSEYSLLTIK